MSIQKLLVPFNFTSYDQKTLDFVIRHFAHQGNIAATLFSVYSPVPVIKSVRSPIMEKMKSNLVYLSQKNNELEAALVEAQSTLIKGGFFSKVINALNNTVICVVT